MMIQYSTCLTCKQRFEQPYVAILLEPARTQALARFGQMLVQHTAQAHPERIGLIQASTMEFNGFLQMTQFGHTDQEFNGNTRKWGQGIINRVRQTIGTPDIHEVARHSLEEIARWIANLETEPIKAKTCGAVKIELALAELREALEKEAEPA